MGICAMEKKTLSRPMKEILTRLEEFEHITTDIFPETVILDDPVEKWPLCDCLIAFHSKGFPLDKAIDYAALRRPMVINDLVSQYNIMDRREVYRILEREGIELPRYADDDDDDDVDDNDDDDDVRQVRSAGQNSSAGGDAVRGAGRQRPRQRDHFQQALR